MKTIAHTLSRNFLGITRAYGEEVLFPAHKHISEIQTPIVEDLLIAGNHIRLVFMFHFWQRG